MRTKAALTLVAAGMFAIMGCTGKGGKQAESSSDQATKPSVTVSILPLKFFVEQIAGQTVNINVLVPPGSSPEMYEPTPSSLVLFSNSDLYFAVGLIDFEKELEQKLSPQQSKYINLSEGADIIEGRCNHQHHQHHNHGADPHIWLSCKEAKRMAGMIAHELATTYPNNAKLYGDNLTRLTATIDSVSVAIQDIVASSASKHFLVYHPSLGYFAREYGLNQVSIEVEGKEPSAQGIANTIKAARASGIRNILSQSQFDSRNAVAIAAELNGNIIEIDPLAENWRLEMIKIASAIAEK